MALRLLGLVVQSRISANLGFKFTPVIYRVLNRMGPKSLTNLFSYKSEKTNYRLRGISSGLSLPKPRTNNMKNSFMYDGAQLWNSIPKEIRESKTLSSFRNKIAAHINGE